jgi:acyl-CoA synthetase (AMP-forming)/AMP-acid ligase II
MQTIQEFEAALIGEGTFFELRNIDLDKSLGQEFINAPRNLQALFRKRQYSNADFLVSEGKNISYSKFLSHAMLLARMLKREFGVGRGGRVAISLDESWSALVMLTAVVFAGGVPVLITGGSQARREEQCTITKCSYLIGDPAWQEISSADFVRIVVTNLCSDEVPRQREILCDFDTLQRYDTGECFSDFDPDPEELAVILFTSGSTSIPKGVMLSHRALIQGAMNMMLSGALANYENGATKQRRRTDGSTLILSSFYHVSGFMQFLLRFFVGNRLILGRHFEISEVARAVSHYHVNSVVGLRLRDLGLLVSMSDEHNLASLLNFHISGAQLHSRILQLVRKKLPQLVLGTSYGMTETSGNICAISGAALDRNPNSLGRITPAVSARVVNDRGRCVIKGVVGHLELSGPMLFSGYCGDSEPVRGKGWFRTGDDALISQDNHLTLVDRSDDFIMTSEGAVGRLSLERMLRDFPGVEDARVLKDPDHPGQYAVAVICDGLETDLAAIQEDVADLIGSSIRVFRVPMLQRAASGKDVLSFDNVVAGQVSY